MRVLYILVFGGGLFFGLKYVKSKGFLGLAIFGVFWCL